MTSERKGNSFSAVSIPKVKQIDTNPHKDDDEDALVRKLKAAKDARISAENDKRTV